MTAVPGSLKPVANRAPRTLFFKIERAFLKGVRVADHQYANEAEHAPENHAAVLNRIPIHDCPRIHEHDFKIEQDKEHCDYIKFNAESRLPLALWNHPAFIGGVFCSRACSALANQDADEQCRKSKQNDNNDLQEDRQIVAQHPGTSPKANSL